MLHETVSRRDFLKASGALVVTFSAAHPMVEAATMAAPARTVAIDQVDGFIAIDNQSRISVFSGKVDLGTGVQTALAQIAAEELSSPLDNVTVIQGDTALTPDQGITWGSLTIQAGGMQVRQACATARDALIAKAAEKLGVSRDALIARDGRILVLGSNRSITYGCLLYTSDAADD